MWKNLEERCCAVRSAYPCLLLSRCLLRWADHIGSGVSCLLSALLLSEFGLRRERANSPQIRYFCC